MQAMNTVHKPVIGLALGSGSARGWAHIGVLRALEQAKIRPDLICGSSIGALVGAAYAVGELDRFEHWILGLGIKDVLSFMDFNLSGGMLKGERLMDFFRRNIVDRPIEELGLPFGAVATALHSGAEVWLRSGSTADAVRASIALPGLFTPVRRDGSLLVDGGLVNPVPVSLARAMGADIVIAVDLNTDILGRHLKQDVLAPVQAKAEADEPGDWMHRLQENIGSLLPESTAPRPRLPSVLDVITSSINIMQVRITRSRMAGEPPEALVAPRLAHLGLLDFYRAREAIDAGQRATEASLPYLRELGLGA